MRDLGKQGGNERPCARGRAEGEHEVLGFEVAGLLVGLSDQALDVVPIGHVFEDIKGSASEESPSPPAVRRPRTDNLRFVPAPRSALPYSHQETGFAAWTKTRRRH